MTKPHCLYRSGLAGLLSAGLCISTAVVADDGPAPSQTDAPVVETTIGRSANVESDLSGEFAEFLGGQQRAETVVGGLRTGETFELQTSGPDGAVTVVEPPTGTMGYGNVRLSLRLAEARLAELGIAQPTDAQLHAMLVGGEIDGVAVDGILAERAAGAGWGEIAQRYDLKVGQLMGKAPARTVATPTVEPTSARGNGYIPSGKTPYRGVASTNRGQQIKAEKQAARANGYIPSGSAPVSSAAGPGGGLAHAKQGGAKKNGYIPSGSSHGRGVVAASGGVAAASSRPKGGLAKGHAGGYVPSGGGAGVVSAANASATASVSAGGGRGQAKGHSKKHK